MTTAAQWPYHAEDTSTVIHPIYFGNISPIALTAFARYLCARTFLKRIFFKNKTFNVYKQNEKIKIHENLHNIKSSRILIKES